MYKGKRILALIPARGGSKGVPDKNIRSLGGRPLIAWTIEAARQTAVIDRVIASTDCPRIAAAARDHGCEVPFLRPAELATDSACTADAVRHALRTLGEEYDLLVLLQPTSPLRTPDDIAACIRLCVDRDAPSVVSLSTARESPFLMYTLERSGAVSPFYEERLRRRQELPSLHVLNGAVYVVETAHFLRHGKLLDTSTLGYAMPPERSVDIDSEWDLFVCQALLEKRR